MFLSAAAVEAATDYGTAERLPEQGAKYVAACDPAGHGEDAFTMSVVQLEGAGADLRVTQVFQKAWDKPRSGLRDLDAVVADCAEQLRHYDLTQVFGDRGMSGWVLEAFRRHRIEYTYPYIKRAGAEVSCTRSVGYLEAAPLLRAGRVRILDDERTRRELRNLEQRGEKVDHPAGLSDDRANSLMLAICMAVHSRGSSPGSRLGSRVTLGRGRSQLRRPASTMTAGSSCRRRSAPSGTGTPGETTPAGAASRPSRTTSTPPPTALSAGRAGAPGGTDEHLDPRPSVSIALAPLLKFPRARLT